LLVTGISSLLAGLMQIVLAKTWIRCDVLVLLAVLTGGLTEVSHPGSTLASAGVASASLIKYQKVSVFDETSNRTESVPTKRSPTQIGAVAMECGAVDDTDALNRAMAAAKAILIKRGTTCAAGSAASFPVDSVLIIEPGGMLKPLPGRKVLIGGELRAGPYQIFTNAYAGGGSISFEGNVLLSVIFPEWWGPNRLDWSPAFQEAAKNRSGRTIVLQNTTYRLDSTVVFNTTQTGASEPAAGFKLKGQSSVTTVIDSHVANGPAFRLYGNVSNAANVSLGFDFHTVLSDFKITTTGSPQNSSGIEISSNWYTRIERVWIENLTSDGLRFDNNSNSTDDANSSVGFIVQHCVIRNNKGYGVRTRESPGYIAIGVAEISYSYIVGNGMAGVLFNGSILKVEGNSIAQNLGGGVYVPPQSSNLTVRILGNEFESNVPYNLNIARCVGGVIENNHFNASDVDANNRLTTTTDIVLGDGVSGENPTYYADRIAVRQNRFRANATSGIRGNIGIDLKQNSRWCVIEGSNWLAYQFLPISGTVSISAGSRQVTGSGTAFLRDAPESFWMLINGQTRQVTGTTSNTALVTAADFTYAATDATAYISPNLRIHDEGVGNQLSDDGEEVVHGWKWFSTTVRKSDSTIQIDLLNGLFQRVVFAVGGKQTLTVKRIDPRTNSAPILSVEVVNEGDDTLSIAFDASFIVRNFVTPTTGNATRCLFVFNPGQGNTWTQVGEWTTSEGFARAGGTFAAVPTSAKTITKSENDYNPGGSSLYQRWSANGVQEITGLTFYLPQVDGQTHYLINVGANDIVLKNQHPGSKPSNRFLITTGADLVLSPNQMALCVYDGSTVRWRCSKLN
jgi:parallel beta helix pectate lyase-like protein